MRSLTATEENFHRSVVHWLRLVRPRAIWFHVPNGEKRDPVTAGRLKAMGVRPGVADLVFVGQGIAAMVELKRPGGGSLSPTQAAFRAECDALGVPYCVARDIDQVAAFLGRLGLLEQPKGGRQ